MGQSLVKNFMHITWGTKHRLKKIDDAISPELFAYLGGICNDLGCKCIIVNGHVDHVHVLCLLNRKITLSKLVEELKSHSSKWIKTKGDQYKDFYWQNGFAGFSVDYNNVEVVKRYIQNQKAHHESQSFQDEYMKLLEKNQIDYNKDYPLD